MSELLGIDDDGIEHFVWMQERGDTCGPACIYMLEREYRQQSTVGGERRIVFLTSLLPNGYREGRGTQAYTALRRVLEQIGMPATAMIVQSMRKFVIDAYYPFITRVAWANGNGHFVVAARTTSNGKLVCLDPWYGLVQTSLNSLPAYTVQSDGRRQMSLRNAIGGTLSGHVIYQSATAA